MNSNKKAYYNGINSENMLIKGLKSKSIKVERLNSIIDLYINGKIFVEVKSCSQNTIDNSTKHGVRKGRFVLNKKQHEVLKDVGGMYIFIMNNENKKSFIKIMEAKNIKYQRLMSWNKVM